LEIVDELVRSPEGVGALLAIEVPVIALTGLVVVAYHAYPVHHVREPIFEFVS
jgi:hypothetical protein